MKLPFLPKFSKKITISYFLVLVLRDEKANAVIFEEQNGKIRTVGQHEEYFEDSVDKASLEELLDVLDKTISTAESSLPPNIETKKTILGVKAAWTEDNKIKKDQLVKLKKVSDELGLTPIGFLVIPEAISHLLQKEEGAPVSAILAEIGKKFINVSLIRGGKIMETKSSKIHDSPSYTIDTLLKHFATSEILPSKIVIFNGKEDLSQQFISHQWSKSLPFLHLPQIINLPFGFDAKAVLFGAASQMGFEVLEKEMHHDTLAPKIKNENTIEEKTIQTPSFSPDFGFVENKDIAKTPLQEPTIEEKAFSQKPDIHIKTSKKIIYSKILNLMSLIKPILSKVLIKIKQISIKKLVPKNKFSMKNKKMLIPIALLLTIVIIFFSIYLFGTSATIILSVKPNIINKTENITFSSSADNIDANVITSELITVSQDGIVNASSTGKKEIGEKSKGTVTVFNNSDETKTLPQGTTITSSNDLDFTLMDSITIASASGDVFTGTTPGKANVNVTASKIGTEYNLPSNTKFRIGNNLLIAAKNDNPFSGGTKKEITVISKEDTDKLLLDLPKKLEQQAIEEFKKTLSNEKVLLPIFISKSIVKKNFDKNIGDQANQVTLTGTVEYEGMTYSEDDLFFFVKNLAKKDSPKDFLLDEKNLKIDIKNPEKKNDKEISAELEIKGMLLPTLNNQSLIEKVKGKSLEEAQIIILKVSGISKVNISISPNLPFFQKTLPRLYKNIKILTNTNG